MIQRSRGHAGPASLMVVAAVLGTLMGSAGPSSSAGVRAQGCVGGLQPGAWTGSYQLDETLRVGGRPIEARNRYSGRLTLDIACDGRVSGSFTLVQSSSLDRNTQDSRDPLLSCTLPELTLRLGARGAGRGRIQSRDAGLALTLPGRLARGSRTACSYPELGGSGFAVDARESTPTGLRLIAASAAASGLSGEQIEWTAPRAWLQARESLFRVADQEARWSLSGPGSRTPTPSPRGPMVTAVRSEYRRLFLQGVGPVPDRFTATVVWGTGGAGTVRFTLGDLTASVAASGSTAETTFDLADLRATAPIVVVAKDARGLTSAAFTGETITIVPPPAWAPTSSDWAVELGAGSVTYTARVPIDPDDLASSLSWPIPGDVPILRGAVGLRDVKPEAVVVVDSLGADREGKVEGKGVLDLLISAPDISFRGDPSARLTDTGVSLVRRTFEGRIQTLRPSFTYGLGDLFPLVWPLTWLAEKIARIDLAADIDGALDASFEPREDKLRLTRANALVHLVYQGGPAAGSDTAGAGAAVTGDLNLVLRVIPAGPLMCWGSIGLIGYVTWLGVPYSARASVPFAC